MPGKRIVQVTRSVGVENLRDELQRFENEGWDVDKIVPDTSGGFVVVGYKEKPTAKAKR